MRSRPSASIVIVDTEAYELAQVALHNAEQRFAAERVLIFSDDPARWSGRTIEPISKIGSMADYNRTIIERLPERLETDFALIVQYDGFPIDVEAFTDDFYGADYIGAPWPATMFPEHGAIVGNGGFSLRSRRLVEQVAARAGEIDFEAPEDTEICVRLRGKLEAEGGIRFADVDLARRFSAEWDLGAAARPFGFHGLHLLPKIYRSNYRYMLDHLPSRCLRRGSVLLDQLRFGFATLGDEAREDLEARVA
jgi:hypothetical protein